MRDGLKFSADGQLKGSAKGKIGELKKLGHRFSGMDHAVILSLPRAARASFRGLTFFEHEVEEESKRHDLVEPTQQHARDDETQSEADAADVMPTRKLFRNGEGSFLMACAPQFFCT